MRRENSPRGADQCLLLPRRRPRERVGLPRSRLQPRGPPGMGRGGGIQTLAALLRTGRLHRRWLRTVRDGRTSVNTGEPVTWRGEMSSAEDGRRRTISPPVGRDPSSEAVDRRQTASPQIETKWITWRHRPGTPPSIRSWVAPSTKTGGTSGLQSTRSCRKPSPIIRQLGAHCCPNSFGFGKPVRRLT